MQLQHPATVHTTSCFVALFSLCLLILPPTLSGADTALDANQLIREIIKTTRPLEQPRGERLPLYLWPVRDLGTTDEAEFAMLARELEARGIAIITSWRGEDRPQLEQALRIGKIQQQLGLPIAIDATSCTYAFCNGDTLTAHRDAQGNPFFDNSFGKGHDMGCPFALDFRLGEMRRRIEEPVKAYREAGLEIKFIFADWEIDGPIEWNDAWAHSKRCTRCRQHIPAIDDFRVFQAALRRKRSQLQKEMLAQPVLDHFPDALVGNYGVYPDDGFRYWYDYFEKFVEGAPHKIEGRARYRRWFPEFPLTGYTFAMPVVYTWDYIFNWYDFVPADYRWFYNMLLVGSNAGRATPGEIPIIPFVHWHAIELETAAQTRVEQFSETKYRELLWHLLLRGHDTFFMWSPQDQALKESQLVHQVYAASHPYRDFLSAGKPLEFAIPPNPGAVVSALKLGSRLLVRRTDFDADQRPVPLLVDGQTIPVPRRGGSCQIIELP